MRRKEFLVCVIFSLWTILQTGLHLIFAIYAYFMSICQRTPTQAATIFFYLTYSYNENCDKPVLKGTSTLEPGNLETYAVKFLSYTLNSNITTTFDGIVKDLLDKIDLFPEYANASSRASVFLLCFIILDGTWVISAVALLMGTSFGIKQSLSLVFYGPWLVMTACVSLFDIAATVSFGLDVPETVNFTNWFKFVGIQDTSEFEDFDARDLPFYIPLAPTLALCFICSRCIVLWILNWIGFAYVLRAAVSAFRKTYKNEPRLRTRRSHSSPSHRSQMDPDTSAARIRSWQLFYGAIESTSSHSSKSTLSERDFNSNKGARDEDVEMQSVPSVSGTVSNGYFAYPDVAESIDGGNNLCLDELRGQLPWSYIPTQDDKRRDDGNRTKRNHRLKSDSSASGTEL